MWLFLLSMEERYDAKYDSIQTFDQLKWLSYLLNLKSVSFKDSLLGGANYHMNPQADHPLLVGAVVDWNLSNDLLLFIGSYRRNIFIIYILRNTHQKAMS